VEIAGLVAASISILRCLARSSAGIRFAMGESSLNALDEDEPISRSGLNPVDGPFRTRQQMRNTGAGAVMPVVGCIGKRERRRNKLVTEKIAIG
jgi:hypothetical protein